MQCEMCGTQVPQTRQVRIDSSTLNVCARCAKFGAGTAGSDPQSRTAANVSEGLERRARRMGSKDVFSSERMQLELVEDFGDRIRQAREAKGMSRQELGGRIKEPENAVAKMEAGSLHPTDAVARRLERELGIKLMEPVRSAVPLGRKAPARGLTLGDMLKDATKGKE